MAKGKLPTLAQVVGGKGSGNHAGIGGTESLPSLAAATNNKQDVVVVSPPKKGGGFLGAVEHVAGQTVSDLYNTAVHSPSGLYQAGKAVAEATAGNPKPLLTLAEATGKGVVTDLKHPLRHPGNTLLDAGSLLSLGAGAAARVGEVGRVAEAGEGAGAVAKAALKGPKPEARNINLGERGSVARGYYSRSASTRAIQKGIDKLQEKHPNVRFGLRNQPEKVGFERAQNERVRDAIRSHPAHALVAVAKQMKVDKAQRLALRVVAEEVPLGERIADTQKFLTDATGRTKRLLQNHLTLLRRTQTYVHDVASPDGRLVPRIRPAQENLVELYARSKKVADKRERDLIDAGYLTNAGAQARKDAPGNLSRTGAAYPLGKDAANGQMSLLSEHGFNPDVMPELFHNREGFYVTYRLAKSSKSLGKGVQLGIRNQIGVPKIDAELTHEYSGAANAAGLVHPDTPLVVAESALRSNRLLSLFHQRDELKTLAKSKVTDPANDIPIRPIWMKSTPWPAEIRAYIDNLDQGLIPEAEQPGIAKKVMDFVLPREEFRASHVGLEIPGVEWIDKRELGKLNLPGPLVGAGQHPGFSRAISTVDAINNAERAAILYAKPAYIAPNVIGNTALNMIQQGVFAPVNLTKSALLNSRLGTDLLAKLDAVMGEGVVKSLGNAQSVGHRAIDKAANFYQKGVDTPFRRAAFLHEARRAGYRTIAQVKTLLEDPAKEEELIRVTRSANDAIIDYGRLGPVERDFIRRIVFFYPWVKGSTQYGARFLADHPQQAALLGQEGKQGAAKDLADLGHVPSFADGIFRVGSRNGTPMTLNFNNAGVINTPAQLLEGIKNLGSASAADELGQNLTPVLQAIEAVVNRQGVRSKQSPLQAVVQQMLSNLPAVATVQGLRHPPADSAKPRMYPRTQLDVLLHYLLGTSPTPYNPTVGERSWYTEQHPH